jgi:hypothetical protein
MAVLIGERSLHLRCDRGSESLYIKSIGLIYTVTLILSSPTSSENISSPLL